MSAVGSILQQIRIAGAVRPQAIKDNTEYVGSKGSTPLTVDTAPLGIKYNSGLFIVALGATDIAMATVKVYHSEDDVTYSLLTDFDTDGTLPSATDDNKFFGFDLDLRKADRYLQIELIPGNGTTGTYATAFCLLADATAAPNTDAERGFAEIVNN